MIQDLAVRYEEIKQQISSVFKKDYKALTFDLPALLSRLSKPSVQKDYKNGLDECVGCLKRRLTLDVTNISY